MNRNDNAYRGRLFSQGAHYLVGEGRPQSVRILATRPATDTEPAKVLVRHTDGHERLVPRDWISKEPRRFNRNSPIRRARRAAAQLLTAFGVRA